MTNNPQTTYLLYLDASGDYGQCTDDPNNASTPYYCLSGIILNIIEWNNIFNRIIQLRRELKTDWGFLMHSELKGSEIIHIRNSKVFKNTKCKTRKQRFQFYHQIMARLAGTLHGAHIINLFLNKTISELDPNRYFEESWKRLLNRYHRFLAVNEGLGIIIPDDGDEIPLKRLTRKLRRYNPTPSHFGGSYSNPLISLIEDPFHRNSKDSYFIQLCDLIVHALYRQEIPKGSYKRYNGERLFKYLDPVLLREANKSDPQGVIRI